MIRKMKVLIGGFALLTTTTMLAQQVELHNAKITGNISLGIQEVTAVLDLETDCIYKTEPHIKGLFVKDENVKI